MSFTTINIEIGSSVELAVPTIFLNENPKFFEYLDQFKAFREFKENIIADGNLELKRIEIQSVDYFGKRIGFLKFKTVCFSKIHNCIVPGIVFMRGGAVGILIVIKCTNGKKYTILTKQARVPVGSSGLLEIPAGMVDNSGSIAGVAVKEIEEETGIIIGSVDQLIDLQKASGMEDYYSSKFKGYMPSAGGCDEFLRLYALELNMTSEELEQINGKIHGEVSEHEKITLYVEELDRIPTVCPDLKSVAAWGLYKNFVNK